MNKSIWLLAQVPPPLHGQSVMVGHLVRECLRKESERYVHINARFSRNEQDVGVIRAGKYFALIRLLLAIFWQGIKRPPKVVYYVPAPDKTGAMLRDIAILSWVRLWCRNFVFHWHGVGLGERMERTPRSLAAEVLFRLLKGHALSICLTATAAADVRVFSPGRIEIIPNGIPDQCLDFELLCHERRQRLATRLMTLTSKDSPTVEVNLLYIGLCSRSKGIYHALSTAEAIARHYNERRTCWRVKLVVAGPFSGPDEEAAFLTAVDAAMRRLPEFARGMLEIRTPGLVERVEKVRLLREADLFLFPSTYENEGLPLTVIECLSFGLPVLTTRWRGIPDALTPDYPFLTEVSEMFRLPALGREALEKDIFQELRMWYLKNFQLKSHLDRMMKVLEGQLSAH